MIMSNQVKGSEGSHKVKEDMDSMTNENGKVVEADRLICSKRREKWTKMQEKLKDEAAEDKHSEVAKSKQ